MANKILVVDDLELNRELLQEMLENEYDVMLAEKRETGNGNDWQGT